MSTFTSTDLNNAHKFAQTNQDIRLLKKLPPHLASWLDVKLRPATNDDYFIPEVLKHAAFVLEVNPTEEFCKASSCTSVKETSTCEPLETASYYRVGDDSYDIQCQPACFNTIQKTKITEASKKRSADIGMLVWNGKAKKCRYANSEIINLLEKPYWRSDVKFEKRVNDMPTGYSRVQLPNELYNTGRSYRNNAAYCQYYDKTIQDNGDCDFRIWEKGLDAVVGMSLINTVKSSIRMVSSDHPFPLPENLPKLPDTIPLEYTLDGWKANIRADFKIPDLIDTKPRATAEMIQNAHNRIIKSKGGDATEIENMTPQEMHDQFLVDDELNWEISSSFMRQSMGLKQTAAEIEKEKARNDKIDETDRKDANNKLSKAFGLIAKSFTQAEMYEMIGTDVAFSHLLSRLKKQCVAIAEQMSMFVARELPSVATKISETVLSKGVSSFILRQSIASAMSLSSASAIFAAKTLAASATGVGYLLMAAQVLNIIFEFWDPYGYSNMHPNNYPKDLMQLGERMMREKYEGLGTDYSFDSFIRTVLSQDEITESNIRSMFDVLIYLDALEVNSEGSRIDKGSEINLALGNRNDLILAQNKGLASRVKFDPASFELYNERFMSRVDLNRYLNYTAAMCLLTSGALLFLRLNALSIVFLIICVVVLAVARLSLVDDSLVDALYKLTDRNRKYNPSGYPMT